MYITTKETKETQWSIQEGSKENTESNVKAAGGDMSRSNSLSKAQDNLNISQVSDGKDGWESEKVCSNRIKLSNSMYSVEKKLI
jgi:hypothetical protein